MRLCKILFCQIIDLQHTDKSRYIVLNEFNSCLLWQLKEVICHFSIHAHGYNYSWAEQYLQQNVFRQYYAWADHYLSEVVYRSCGGLWANQKEANVLHALWLSKETSEELGLSWLCRQPITMSLPEAWQPVMCSHFRHEC